MKKFIKKIIFKLLEVELFLYKKNKSDKKKLLIVKIDAIGDFIIFSPMIKYYKKLYPNHSMSIVVNKLNKDLIKRFDNIDKVLIFDRVKFRKNPFKIRNLFIKIKKENFDIAISPTFSREIIGDYLIKISGADKKIGFNGDLSNITKKDKIITDKFYTNLISIDDKTEKETRKNEEFINQLGANVKNITPVLKISENDTLKAKEILKKNGLENDRDFIVIFPGSGGPGKKWPTKKYTELINWIKKEKNIEIVIAGAKNEERLVAQIKEGLNFNIINIVGQTTLPVFSAILKLSILYVGNDTGPVHLASAVGTPTICLIGGGDFGRFFPYGDLSKNKIVYNSMPCFQCRWNCKYNRFKCIEDIKLEKVTEEINKII